MGTEEYGKGRPGDKIDYWLGMKDDTFVIAFSAKIPSLVLTREEARELARRILQITGSKETSHDLVKVELE